MPSRASFQQTWKTFGRDEDAPYATDEERTWREVLFAATLQGAIFAAVKAAVYRVGATQRVGDRNLARLTRKGGGRAGTTRIPALRLPTSKPVRRTLTAMSDQHAAAALTAAAVIAAILVARAAVLHQPGRAQRARAAHPPRRRTAPRADTAPPSPAKLSDDAFCTVREAEQHVHNCWQRLRTRVDPSE
ncbi:DUF4235 domain-containing protein [Streptomyces sp. NPDC001920]